MFNFTLCSVLPAPTHTPVLLHEVLADLQLQSGASVLDCTLGLGGHAKGFIETIGSAGILIGLDADAENLKEAESRLSAYKNIRLMHANFSELPDCLPRNQRQFDVIFADLGVSSPHVDLEARGFTFHGSAPLDMRYNRDRGPTASDLLMTLPERDLLRIFRSYGELRRAHVLVRGIADARRASVIGTSADFVEIIASAYGYRARNLTPQIFQALRIAVNDELGALEHLLRVAPDLLKPGGRMSVMTYHSLEDRLVKHAFKKLCTPAYDDLTGRMTQAAAFSLIHKKPIAPAEDEVRQNPRSRSAKLRTIARTFDVS